MKRASEMKANNRGKRLKEGARDVLFASFLTSTEEEKQIFIRFLKVK